MSALLGMCIWECMRRYQKAVWKWRYTITASPAGANDPLSFLQQRVGGAGEGQGRGRGR